jgi:hypothetical protein
LLESVLKEQGSEASAPASYDSQVELKLLNSVNLQPKPIEVKESSLWKQKDLSNIKDLKTIEHKVDWSFSTPYKGTITSL